jgi:phosphonate transport system substrate-binding protein
VKYLSLLLLAATLLLAAACSASQNVEESEPFVIGAIPDQDPELLQRLYGSLANYLEAELGVPVEYRPVTDYTAAVTAFRVGDLDMVWFGGLTGVQARLQVPGAQALAQRAIDEQFTSVFIANRDSGLSPLDSMDDLAQLAGHTFTFGSESSTSGRLMPQYFLQEAGISPDGFDGEVGFSGSHDTTIELVEAGSYQAGALNSQVWDSRVAEGEVDLERVQEIWRTPPYHDYHWVMRPDVQERFGDEFPQQVTEALLALDAANPEHSEILELFGAQRFIETENGNYAQIEAIGRQIGQIVANE